jgi:hypothetical protein
MMRQIPRVAGAGAALLFGLLIVLGIGHPALSAAWFPAVASPAWGTDVRVNPTTSLTPDLQANFSLAVNPTDPNNLIASYDSLDPNNTNSAYSVSTDAGRTWTGAQFYGSWSPTDRLIPFGNNSVRFDRNGVAYYTGQAAGESGSGYFVLTSTTGLAWSTPVPISVDPGYVEYHDQAHLAVDTSAGGSFAGSLYIAWRYTSDAVHGIKLRYSRDGGHTWTADIPVSDPGHDESWGPSIVTAADGTIYVAFENNPRKTATLLIDRSTDGGVTWGTDRMITGAPITKAGALDFKEREHVLPGDVYSNGLRINNYPVLAVPPSGGNTIYAVWNDGRWDSEFTFYRQVGKHADIAFSRSTDGGVSWTAPVRVNDDAIGNGVDQFMPSMAVAADGGIGVSWYDRRNDPSGYYYDLYYSQSTDEGVTWSAAQRVSDLSSDPLAVRFAKGDGWLGDYNGLAFGPDYVVAGWVDSRAGYAEDFYADRGVLPSITPSPPPSASASPTPSPTPSASPSPQPCNVAFADVPPSNTFYPYVQYVACHGIVSGYPCGGPGEPCPGSYFRPNNNSTRGQVSKMIVLGVGWPIQTPTAPTFADVAPGSTFYGYIETAYAHGVISGYPCGTPGEPCPGRYFRPNNNVTRGQLSKIVVSARGWGPLTPATGSFNDVPPGDTFYGFIEQARAKGLISGYPCGGPFEPCDPPANRPYFRPGNNATRGQFSKILYLALAQP